MIPWANMPLMAQMGQHHLETRFAGCGHEVTVRWIELSATFTSMHGPDTAFWVAIEVADDLGPEGFIAFLGEQHQRLCR